jgi:UDP-N-acetylmuramate dehydrogenase
MLYSPDDPASHSAGSFFVNPVLSTDEHALVESRARRSGVLVDTGQIPTFPASHGSVKIPAAWLIERAGYPRGLRRGRVGLSERHALAIVNHGGATAREVLALAGEIRDAVADSFGVHLAPEPVFLGLPQD